MMTGDAADRDDATKSAFTGHSRAFWDARYGGDVYTYGTAPNAFLASQAERLSAGWSALAPGDGEGRNSVWLASRGLNVTAVDLSSEGIAKGEKLAADRGVSVAFLHRDLAVWEWPIGTFDVAAAIYFHLPPDLRPRLHQAMVDSLRPGGLLIVEAFTPDQVRFQKSHRSGGPPQPDMLFTAAMLTADFQGCTPIELAEVEVVLDEGPGHSGPAAVVRGVFRRNDA